jgi:hypothetical protein
VAVVVVVEVDVVVAATTGVRVVEGRSDGPATSSDAAQAAARARSATRIATLIRQAYDGQRAPTTAGKRAML